MTHTYCAFGKCSTCSMLHSLHKCEISSKFSNLLHFTNKITHLRIHRTENAMRNYYNYAFSRTTREDIHWYLWPQPLWENFDFDLHYVKSTLMGSSLINQSISFVEFRFQLEIFIYFNFPLILYYIHGLVDKCFWIFWDRKC